MGQDIPERPDIVGAWRVLEDKKNDFERIRSKQYLDSEGESAIQKSNAAFDVFNTHACQIGAVLTLATLANVAGVKGQALATLSDEVCSCWSAAFESNVVKTRDRRGIFIKDDDIISKPVNRVSKMDTPIAVHFRYFWLELLSLDNVVDNIPDRIDSTDVFRLRDRARLNYFDYLIKEQKKAITKTHPEMNDRETWRSGEDQAKDLYNHTFSI